MLGVRHYRGQTAIDLWVGDFRDFVCDVWLIRQGSNLGPLSAKGWEQEPVRLSSASWDHLFDEAVDRTERHYVVLISPGEEPGLIFAPFKKALDNQVPTGPKRRFTFCLPAIEDYQRFRPVLGEFF